MLHLALQGLVVSPSLPFISLEEAPMFISSYIGASRSHVHITLFPLPLKSSRQNNTDLL